MNLHHKVNESSGDGDHATTPRALEPGLELFKQALA